MAEARPDAVAVVEPLGYDGQGKRIYRHVTFRQLDQDSDRIARGLGELGVMPGTRLALLVRPGIDFVSLVFGLFKAGAVAILIDPGMGRHSLIRCLAEAEPEGFVAIPVVQAVRTLLPGRFPKARFNVTVGRRWPFLERIWQVCLHGPLSLWERARVRAICEHKPDVSSLDPSCPHPLPLSQRERGDFPNRPAWGGVTLEQLRGRAWSGSELAPTKADDPAAIIFTTGSTGPSKGVLFSHGTFDAQVDQIRDFYGIQPGEVDLPAFPLFGLFNCAMGVTAVIPDMDPSRPAQVDPTKIIEAVTDWNVTQTFGSPAIWDRVSQYCEARGLRLPTVRRVLSAGAPVHAEVLRRTKACIHPEGEVHTPYGATEALPVASISAGEVLGEIAEKTRGGAGVCVGGKFSGIQWKVIRPVDGPIRSLDEIEELPAGEIGELIVAGAVVTRQYVTRVQANALAKIADGSRYWHRMGDCGYLDSADRFWFCGRMAHRVLTAEGPMYPVCCEAIFNRHPAVRRSALVGVGPVGRQRPVVILEPRPGQMPRSKKARMVLLSEIRSLGASSPLTERISDFLFHPGLPVDIRHNAKIFREKLAVWAGRKS